MTPDSLKFVAAYLTLRRLTRERREATGRLMRRYAVSLVGSAS